MEDIEFIEDKKKENVHALSCDGGLWSVVVFLTMIVWWVCLWWSECEKFWDREKAHCLVGDLRGFCDSMSQNCRGWLIYTYLHLIIKGSISCLYKSMKKIIW